MFKLSNKELQRRCATKLIQTTEGMFKALGFDNLVEHGVKVRRFTAFYEVFERYALIVKPEGGGEKVFAFDAHRLVKSMCWVWANHHGTVAFSRQEVLRDKALIEKEVKKLSDDEQGRVKKLTGELGVCRQQLCTV